MIDDVTWSDGPVDAKPPGDVEDVLHVLNPCPSRIHVVDAECELTIPREP